LAKILVVEDNALNIKLFCDLLTAHGHETEPVTDSRDALQAALAFHPDLVITDMVMPGMSGRELAEQVHLLSPMTRILSTSGFVRPNQEDEEKEAVYLQKPFTSRELLVKVKSALAKEH